jgi:anti-sigma B factor antagonist
VYLPLPKEGRRVTEAFKGISVRSANGEVYVRVVGRGTFQNGQPLRRYALEMIGLGFLQFVIDLEQCQGMDSTFLGMLAGIGLRLQQDNRQGQVHVVHVGARNMELLQTLGLDRLFDVEVSNNHHTAHPAPPDSEFQKLPDTDIGILSKPLNKNDTADLMLEAHDNLIRADQRNVDRFQDLTQFLRKNVEKRAETKEKPQEDVA